MRLPERSVPVIERLDPDMVAVYRAMTPAQRIVSGLSYVSIDAARQAIRSRTKFNVIHPTSGMKVDFFVAGDAIERSQIARRLRRSILPGTEAWCSPPEELIIKKLAYHSLGGSDKHLRDIGSMLRISPEQIDLPRLRKLAADQQLGNLLDRVLEAVAED